MTFALATLALVCVLGAVFLVTWRPEQRLLPGLTQRCGSALGFIANGGPEHYRVTDCGHAAVTHLVEAALLVALAIGSVVVALVHARARSRAEHPASVSDA